MVHLEQTLRTKVWSSMSMERCEKLLSSEHTQVGTLFTKGVEYNVIFSHNPSGRYWDVLVCRRTMQIKSEGVNKPFAS